MRTALLSIAGAAVLLAGVTPSFASDVNCGIVMKSVKMGRSTQDIADTMLITPEDVDKCKKAAADAPKDGAPAAEKPAAEKKDAPAH